MSLLTLSPAATLLLGAFCCLLIEAAGTAPGHRKLTPRVHLPFLVLATAAFALVAAAKARQSSAMDGAGFVGCALVLFVLVVGHGFATHKLRAMDEERGETSALYLAFAAGACLTCTASDVVMLAVGLVLVAVPAAFVMAPDRQAPHGIEAAARNLYLTAFVVVLLIVSCAALTLAQRDMSLRALFIGDAPMQRVAQGLMLLVLCIVLGAVPLHHRLVDSAHGSSASAAALVTSVNVVIGGVLGVHLLSHVAAPTGPLLVVALASCILAPIAALAQAPIGRVAAFMCATQVGGTAMLLAVSDAKSVLLATTICALSSAAALIGITLLTKDPSGTWEDVAGYGRTRPVVAAFVIYALASLAGLPGTPGFVVRLTAARALFAKQLMWPGILVVFSIAIAAAPIVRLALFLFAKDRTTARTHTLAEGALFLVLLVVMLAFITIAPDVLRTAIMRAGV